MEESMRFLEEFVENPRLAALQYCSALYCTVLYRKILYSTVVYLAHELGLRRSSGPPGAWR